MLDDKQEGMILGELIQFKKEALNRLDKIEYDLERLGRFKMKITGVMIFAVIVIEAYIRIRGYR